MYLKTCSAWADLAMDSWMLGRKASSAIGFRLPKVTSGGKAANDEIHLIVASSRRRLS